MALATVCNGCSEVGELRQKLMDHQTRLIEAETKLNQLKQDLSFTQTKLNLAEQQLLETETELEKKTTSCASLCKRVEDEVKKHHEIRNSRFFENHGPKLDEYDLKTIQSPIYECLKFDVNRKSSETMLEVTKFGKTSLAKNGIFVNKIGEATVAPKQKENVPRSKTLDFTEELERVSDQEMQKLGGKIGDLIIKYYTEPVTAISKRAKKVEKRIPKNYEEKANMGYINGDRLLFQNLAKEVSVVCTNPNQRPPWEQILRKIMRIMDKKAERPKQSSENRW